MSDPAVTTCPSCGIAGSGNFCASCGTALGARNCPACGRQAQQGDTFCRDCGRSLAGGVLHRTEPRLPWLVAGALCFVAIASVVYAAGKRGGPVAPQMANAGNAAGTAAAAPVRAPDISNLTPREQFARLNDRIFAAAESGDSSTVINFWPMAAGAYDNLLPGDRDIDARYHMATLYLLVGQFPATLALADTMMTESPDNLLAWYLRGVVAEFQNDSSRMTTVHSEFDRGFDAEMAKGLDEYVHHADLLREYRVAARGTP